MANIYDMSDTWNDSGTTFTAIKMNVTDTASASDSLLMDLQVGGSSKFEILKNGALRLSGNRPAGSVSPSIVTNKYQYTGFGWDASGYVLELRSAGVPVLLDQLLNVRLADPRWKFGWAGTSGGANDLILARDAAGTLAQRNSTNAQTFNLYNTYTDGSNYERGFMKWNSNVLEVGTEALGTGTGRDVVLNGSNRVSKISDVSTGTDAAYETAINAIIDALEAHGLAATV